MLEAGSLHHLLEAEFQRGIAFGRNYGSFVVFGVCYHFASLSIIDLLGLSMNYMWAICKDKIRKFPIFFLMTGHKLLGN